MKAQLPALLLCGTLSAVVASVVSLLMAESATEVPQLLGRPESYAIGN